MCACNLHILYMIISILGKQKYDFLQIFKHYAVISGTVSLYIFNDNPFHNLNFSSSFLKFLISYYLYHGITLHIVCFYSPGFCSYSRLNTHNPKIWSQKLQMRELVTFVAFVFSWSSYLTKYSVSISINLHSNFMILFLFKAEKNKIASFHCIYIHFQYTLIS